MGLTIQLPTADDAARVYCADVLEFLARLPDDAVDLLMTSPPYLEARSYGIKAGRKLEEWVSWMRAVVEVAAPKVRGLIAINCEGQTRDFRYLPAPFLLIGDMHRAGFNLRKPCVYKRNGIPGSGGAEWLRNDWEPIICVTRPGPLPWSDNTACGHPPKFRPGGAMSYRNAEGVRKNDRDAKRKGRVAEARAEGLRVDTTGSRRKPNGDREHQLYVSPDLANPGNVIDCGAVGGGRMGDQFAHENEAPFPEDLPAFFVKSFCPPGGVVCDPFCGSGTVAKVAVVNGRLFVGCDVRQSQVDLTTRRLAGPLGVGGLFGPPVPPAPALASLFPGGPAAPDPE